MELFRKVYIKSVSDYPKKEGYYFCCRSGFLTLQYLISHPTEKTYMREIKWYLEPITTLYGACFNCGKFYGELRINPFIEDTKGEEQWDYICPDCYQELKNDV